jgi:hypothetical protein
MSRTLPLPWHAWAYGQACRLQAAILLARSNRSTLWEGVPVIARLSAGMLRIALPKTVAIATAQMVLVMGTPVPRNARGRVPSPRSGFRDPCHETSVLAGGGTAS